MTDSIQMFFLASAECEEKFCRDLHNSAGGSHAKITAEQLELWEMSQFFTEETDLIVIFLALGIETSSWVRKGHDIYK